MGQRTLYTAGEYGNTVSIVRRKDGGNLYLRVPDDSYSGGYRMESLGHTDLRKAKSRADRVAAQLREGVSLGDREPTLDTIFRLYKRHEVPDKGQRQKQRDKRGMAFWRRMVGGGKRPSEISSADWTNVLRARKEGRVTARGKPAKDRDPVRWSTVWRDLYWLKKVLRWATRWRTQSGSYLLSENPVRGYRMPDRETPDRPIASRERYRTLVKVAKDQQMRVTWGGGYSHVRSHLWELLDVVVGTGRRIGAVCGLRWRDLHLEPTEEAPYGSIAWPRQTDKQDEPWRAPLTPKAREALLRARERFPGIADAPVFPKPTDRSRTCIRGSAHRWLKDAETDAELEPMDGGAWHPYRRMWATERMHLPRQAVARAGGWADPDVMEACYQEADDATVRDVVLDPETGG